MTILEYGKALEMHIMYDMYVAKFKGKINVLTSMLCRETCAKPELGGQK